MAQIKNNSDIKQQVLNEASQLEAGYNNLYVQATDSSGKPAFDSQGNKIQTIASKANQNKYMQDYAKKIGMTFENIQDLQSAIKNGLPADDILKTITINSLPIYLQAQEDHTIIATGLGVLDRFIPMIQRENGNITFDYQGTTPGDGKDPYFGSIKGSGKNMTELWQDNPRDIGRETYGADIKYHKTVVTFIPLYVASYKTTFLFMAQLNDIEKQTNEPFMQWHLAYKAKIMWLGAGADAGIHSTDDSLTFDQQTVPYPDITIEGSNVYEVWSELGNKLMNLQTPSKTFFEDNASALRAEEFKIDGMRGNLLRSLDPARTRVVAPIELRSTIAFAMRAGAFNKLETNLDLTNGDFEKMIDYIPYTAFTSPNYGNLVGIKNDMKVIDKDNASGSVDIILYVPGTYQMIDQYSGTDTMRPGNLTMVINTWKKMGFAMRKYENDLVLTIRLTITPKTPETQQVQVMNSPLEVKSVTEPANGTKDVENGTNDADNSTKTRPNGTDTTPNGTTAKK